MSSPYWHLVIFFVVVIGGAIHKNVFAAVIATPLVKKWAIANDLKIVATSDLVSAEVLLVNRNVSLETTQK
jgi:hypothetical protein